MLQQTKPGAMKEMLAMNRSIRKLGKGERKKHFPDLLEMPRIGKKKFSVYFYLCIYAEREREKLQGTGVHDCWS